MCDYDVRMCKIIIFIVATILGYALMDFMYIRLPEMQYQAKIQAEQRKTDDYNQLRDLLSNINVNANIDGNIDSRVRMSGYLFEPSM